MSKTDHVVADFELGSLDGVHRSRRTIQRDCPLSNSVIDVQVFLGEDRGTGSGAGEHPFSPGTVRDGDGASLEGGVACLNMEQSC